MDNVQIDSYIVSSIRRLYTTLRGLSVNNEQAIKTVLILGFFLFYNLQKIIYNTLRSFSVWCRTGSNPADINRLRSHTEKVTTCIWIQQKTSILDKFTGWKQMLAHQWLNYGCSYLILEKQHSVMDIKYVEKFWLLIQSSDISQFLPQWSGEGTGQS